MEPSPVLEREGAVLHVVLNHPERLNAISLEEHESILTALSEAAANGEVRVVVFSGRGRSFCAGDYINSEDQGWPARLAHRRIALDIGLGPLLLNEVTAAIWSFPKPTVALLHGHALGAGYDYASSCDFRLSTQGCRIGDPRIKLALWGAEVWSYKLPRLLDQSRVAPLTYLGEPFSGREAREMGFVHQVFDDQANLRACASPLLERLAALDAESYRALKAELRSNLDASWRQAAPPV